MGNSIESQAYIFLSTLYGGIIIGFIYDLYRIFRYFSKPKKVAAFIEDLIFWIIVAVVSLIILIFSNWGELRGYVFIGFISGAFLYIKVLSKIVITILVHVIRFFIKILRHIANIIFYPFRLLGRVLYEPYHKLRTNVKKGQKKVSRLSKLPLIFLKDIKKHGSAILNKK